VRQYDRWPASISLTGRFAEAETARSRKEPKGEDKMAIQVVEIHHPAVRIAGDAANLRANLDFYQGLLGLTPDGKRPDIRDVPGFWINVGEVGQIHLIGGPQPSWMAKGEGRDPTSPHIALAVTNVAEAKAELESRGVDFWTLTGIAGPQAEQLFMSDPNGNIIELHQVDQCRCRAANRR
jgi:catechol 2,3-dioxygenase-like lactoylglutathione lyase family enzyme